MDIRKLIHHEPRTDASVGLEPSSTPKRSSATCSDYGVVKDHQNRTKRVCLKEMRNEMGTCSINNEDTCCSSYEHEQVQFGSGVVKDSPDSASDDICSSEANSDFSTRSSRRSTVTSTESDNDTTADKISSLESFLSFISKNKSKPLDIEGIQFKDESLHTNIRSELLTRIHQKYVEPLLDQTGFKWIRKELPSKGKGIKIFSIKYTCSQQANNPLPQTMQSSENPEASRRFSNPLKQYDCNSLYSIKFVWSSSTVVISYRHTPHPPYKRLPEKLKPYILARLDMKAVDLFNQILADDQFEDIKSLIFFSKVQSYWSKQRIIRRDKSTKEAFAKFFKE